MTRALTCAETFKRLDDFLDRELSESEWQDVSKHLDDCERCAAEFGVEEELLTVIRERLRLVRAPDGLMQRILRRIYG